MFEIFGFFSDFLRYQRVTEKLIVIEKSRRKGGEERAQVRYCSGNLRDFERVDLSRGFHEIWPLVPVILFVKFENAPLRVQIVPSPLSVHSLVTIFCQPKILVQVYKNLWYFLAHQLAFGPPQSFTILYFFASKSSYFPLSGRFWLNIFLWLGYQYLVNLGAPKTHLGLLFVIKFSSKQLIMYFLTDKGRSQSIFLAKILTLIFFLQK